MDVRNEKPESWQAINLKSETSHHTAIYVEVGNDTWCRIWIGTGIQGISSVFYIPACDLRDFAAMILQAAEKADELVEAA